MGTEKQDLEELEDLTLKMNDPEDDDSSDNGDEPIEEIGSEQGYTVQVFTASDYAKEKAKLLGMRNKYDAIRQQMDLLEPGQAMVVELREVNGSTINGSSVAQILRKHISDTNLLCKVIVRENRLIIERFKKLPGQV